MLFQKIFFVYLPTFKNIEMFPETIGLFFLALRIWSEFKIIWPHKQIWSVKNMAARGLVLLNFIVAIADFPVKKKQLSSMYIYLKFLD